MLKNAKKKTHTRQRRRQHTPESRQQRMVKFFIRKLKMAEFKCDADVIRQLSEHYPTSYLSY